MMCYTKNKTNFFQNWKEIKKKKKKYRHRFNRIVYKRKYFLISIYLRKKDMDKKICKYKMVLIKKDIKYFNKNIFN